MSISLLERPVTDDLGRRGFVTGAAAAALLAGCSAGPAPAPSAGATAAFVDSAKRTVQVPVRPQRIVALHVYSAGQALLSIGAPIVGLEQRDGAFDESLAGYDLSTVKPVGALFDLDLEAVAALQPDLIIALATPEGKPLIGETDPAAVERMAPTVYLIQNRPVEEYMADIATLTGLTAEVDRQRAEFERGLADLRSALADRKPSFAVVGYIPPTVYLENPSNPSPFTVIGLRLGMRQVPAAVTSTTTNYAELSGEELTRVSADLVLHDPAVAELPLWSRLPAVGAGQAFPIPQISGSSFVPFLKAVEVLRPIVPGLRADVVDESSWTP